MRHLPGEAEWSLEVGEGLGSPSDWGWPVLEVDPEVPMRVDRRGIRKMFFSGPRWS